MSVCPSHFLSTRLQVRPLNAFLPCDAIAGMRCPFVTFVCCAKTTKDIFEFFNHQVAKRF